MERLHIDIETYSSADLRLTGVYKYAEAADFEILLVAYAYNNGPVELIDLTKTAKSRLDKLKADLLDPNVEKIAFNANFERTCFASFFKMDLPPEQWTCTRVQALAAGLPGSLAGAGDAVLPEADRKDKAGTDLIAYFCGPVRPTIKNGGRTRNRPEHDPEGWAAFKEYCRQDVKTERELGRRLQAVKLTADERAAYALDQRINDRGVLIDEDLVAAAVAAEAAARERYLTEARKLTGLPNPGSAQQLKGWLAERTGREFDTLRKAEVKELIEAADTPAEVRQALKYRLLLAKSSVAKYRRMAQCACADGRARGLFQFYGANRTGRWAGRLIQLQNLKRNTLEPLGWLRELILTGEGETVEDLFTPVPFALSELVRTALIAAPGHTLVVSDFSAIEARVLAWLAGEDWVLNAFRTHGKIYEATAAQMFHVPLEDVTKGSDLRQRGKVATLACGYGGGVVALQAMGGAAMGLTEDEMKDTVNRWRDKNAKIVALWAEVERAAVAAFNTRRAVRVKGAGAPLRFGYFDNDCGQTWLTIDLPSGRRLYYAEPELRRAWKFGREVTELSYLEVVAGGKWARVGTYGGKLTENITQAVARDCLADAMVRMERAGLKLVAHIHDEVIAEVAEDEAAARLEELNEIMATPPAWADGLPLKGDGYVTRYYRKD